MPDISKMTDEQLASLAEDLAKKRTEIREKQVAVQAEIDLRHALDAMPAEARRIVTMRLKGGIAPAGEHSTEGAGS